MATHVLDDVFVSVNAVDLSDHLKSSTLTYEGEAIDQTAMGDSTRKHIGGLKNWNLELMFYQDYAGSSVDATLFPLVNTTTAIIVRPVATGGVSATNPNFTGTGLVQAYPPITGEIGSSHEVTCSIVAASDLTRATA